MKADDLYSVLLCVPSKKIRLCVIMALLTREQFIGPAGHTLTRALFFELSYNKQEDTVFTVNGVEGIKNKFGKEMIPISRIFVDLVVDDPTEYEFSQAVFGDWAVWATIRECTVLKPHLDQWRTEADVKRKSLAFSGIVNEVKTGGRSAFTASKFLIDFLGIDVDKKDARKARQQAQTNAEEAFEVSGLNDDIERLRNEGKLQ